MWAWSIPDAPPVTTAQRSCESVIGHNQYHVQMSRPESQDAPTPGLSGESLAGLDGARAAPAWGSDAFAEVLARLELPYIALNPGASYRGLHDSLVNYNANRTPQMILCLHEEHAVALAHGYAKVTGRPLAVALHSNVGLMHATMALFNAWCDRVPMLVIGATGPLDAAERRPWIDWIHTAVDQGALVRPFIKWDDQPGSAQAGVEALVRADQVTRTHPSAPVYVCFDAAIQEAPLEQEVVFPDLARHRPPRPPGADAEVLERLLGELDRAKAPLILAGRVNRSDEAWAARVRVAERLGARVLTDLKTPGSFPSAHPLNSAVPGTFLTPSGAALLRAADYVLALDWVDLAGTLSQAAPAGAMIASCSLDHTLHGGWSKDHFALAPVDLPIEADPDALVAQLDARLSGPPREPWAFSLPPAPEPEPLAGPGVTIGELAGALSRALAGRPACLVRLPLSWDGADLALSGPLDYLGQDGGAGLGSGPGMAVGAALALAGEERLAVAVLGDGDTLMGASALWTAAHCGLRLLVLVANNRSFFNDEVHQERVALRRGRPVENRWIGQRIDGPPPDFAGLAGSLGFTGHGPIEEPAELEAVLAQAVGEAIAGACVLVDVRTSTRGYPGGPTAGA
jgi:thiamine pyrophosphate-dependent acetolactate synthase large subunit-like protein